MENRVHFNLWFCNGTHIEKDVNLENLSEKEVVEFVKSLDAVQNIVKNAFVDNTNAQVTLHNMTVRVRELIAFDFVLSDAIEI